MSDRFGRNDSHGHGRPQHSRPPVWNAEKEDRLKAFVRCSNGEPNWKMIAAEMGVRVSAVQNKYTAMTEPHWTKEQEEKLLAMWRANSEDIPKLVAELNAACNSVHTERGTMLMLERITKGEPKAFRMEREAKPERSLRDELAPLIMRLQDQLQDNLDDNVFAGVAQRLREAADKIEEKTKKFEEQ